MRKIIITLNLFFFCIIIAGQSKIVFPAPDYYLQMGITLQWTINNVTFSPTADGVTIYPHEKGMDTIFFQETRVPNYPHEKGMEPIFFRFDTVFSRIPNGQELIMSIGCCDDGFDILRKEDYEKRVQLFLSEPSLDFDSLDMILLEFGTLKFVILNKPISDTLICAYVGEYTLGQMITVNKDYGWVKPCRVGYIDNIIDIYILKVDENIEYEIFEEKEKNECSEGIDIVSWRTKYWEKEKDLKILKRFGLRLFNNEKVIIKYDYLTGEIKLQIMLQY